MTAPLPVAIAAEAPYDTRIIQVLVERLLDRPIVPWVGAYKFNGCKSVATLALAFLGAAARADIRHALLAIDNDGGSRKRPEHADSCILPTEFNANDDDGCRECWLHSAVPLSWTAGGGKSCIVVPVQTIETWLLTIRGDDLGESPEGNYHRPTLKKKFYGERKPSFERGLAIAMVELRKTNAVDVLRRRESFQRFAGHLASWP